MVITIKCETCSSSLDISPEMNKLACGYCGASQIVERKGGTVNLRLVTDAIKKVQIGTDKTAAELALKRLAGEYEDAHDQLLNYDRKVNQELSNSRRAWVGSGLLGGVIGLIVMTQATETIVFGLIFALAVFIGLVYFGFQFVKKTELESKEGREGLVFQVNNLKAKIAKNRRLVD